MNGADKEPYDDPAVAIIARMLGKLIVSLGFWKEAIKGAGVSNKLEIGEG